MFNKILGTLAVVLVMTAPAASAEMNIVVLDPVRAILESDEAKVLAEAANKEMEPEIEELRVDARTARAGSGDQRRAGPGSCDSQRICGGWVGRPERDEPSECAAVLDDPHAYEELARQVLVAEEQDEGEVDP